MLIEALKGLIVGTANNRSIARESRQVEWMDQRPCGVFQ